MTRKNTRRRLALEAKPNVMIWDADSRLELLAYLNWCVLAEVDFKTTAEHHIREVTAKNVSFKQIQRRLRREWDNFGKTNNFEDVYVLGTAAFLDYEDDAKRIGEIVERLGPPPTCRYELRGGSARLGARSQTLSTTAPSTRVTPASTPRQASRLYRASHLHNSLDTPNLQARIATPQSTTTDASNIVVHKLAQEARNTVVKDDHSEGCSTAIVDNSDVQMVDSPSLEINESTASQLTGSLQAKILDLTAQLESKNRDLLKQEASAFTLRSLIFELRSELKAMHDCNYDTTQEISKLVRENCILTGRLGEKNRLFTGLTLLQNRKIGAPSGDMRKEYDALFQEIHDAHSFLGKMNLDEAFYRQQDYSHQSAKAWAKRVSGYTLDYLITYCKTEAIPKEKAFASLVGAAIFELVFEPVFPEVVALDSPILHQYRRFIFTKYERQGLRQADHFALSWLRSDEYFTTEVIPEKAKSLAGDIVRTLQFFLPLEGEDSARPCPDYSTNLVAVLGIPLNRALKLKVDFDQSMARLKFVYFKPGEAFNPDEMKIDITPQMRSPNKDQHGQQSIKICMLPALYAFPPENYDEDAEEGMRQFSANCSDGCVEAKVEDVRSLILVAKAVVLV